MPGDANRVAFWEQGTMLTPILWALLGAALGGFLSAEAFSYGSIVFALGVVVVPPAGLALWAKIQGNARHLREAAGYLFGAGLLGSIFAVPQVFASGLSNGPIIPAVLYLVSLLSGLGIYLKATGDRGNTQALKGSR